MDKPKNSKAKIQANNRYKNKTYKRIAIDIKPTEAEYIRDTAKKYNLSVAQLILQAIKLYDNNTDTIATAEDMEDIKSSREEYHQGKTINHNDINWD